MTYLSDVHLIDGECHDCFEALASKFPRLKDLYMCGDLTAASGKNRKIGFDHDRRLNRYLVQGGPPKLLHRSEKRVYGIDSQCFGGMHFRPGVFAML